MNCSTEQRLVGIFRAAIKITGSYSVNGPVHYLSRVLAASFVLASCLCSSLASAGSDISFSGSVSQSGYIQQAGIDRQLARIAELEGRGSRDAYSPELADAYLGLAAAYAAMENHTAALNTYGKALQVVRVSEGLDSRKQLPILQAQLDSMEKLQQWSRYDSTLNLIYLISQDQLPVGDDGRIKVLNQLSKWQLRAAEEGLLQRVEKKARMVADMYEKEFGKIEAPEAGYVSVSDYGVSSLHLGKAFTSLTMARIAIDKPLSDYRSLNSTATLASSGCRPVALSGNGASQSCMAAPIPNLNYYQVPEQRRKQVAGLYLEELRTDILEAGETLEKKSDFDNRQLLVDDFRFLAESYSQMVSMVQTR